MTNSILIDYSYRYMVLAPVGLSFKVQQLKERFKFLKAQNSTINQLTDIEMYNAYDVQYEVCDILDKVPRALLSIHREASKSTMAESFCFRKLASKEDHLIVYFSITVDASVAHLEAIKMKFEANELKDGTNNRYNELMPKRGKGYNWGKLSFTTKNGNKIIGGGIGKGVLGMKKGDLRPTIIIIDDPVPLKPGEDDSTKMWLKQTIFPLGGPNTQIIIIGTPRRYNDMLMDIINDEETAFEIYNYPALNEDNEVLIPQFWKRRGICCQQRNYLCHNMPRTSDKERKNIMDIHQKAYWQGMYKRTDMQSIYYYYEKDDYRWAHLQFCCDRKPKYQCWDLPDDSDELMWQHIKQKQREVGSVAWATEYMCKPADDGTSLFPYHILEGNMDNNWTFKASRLLADGINEAYRQGGRVPRRIQCVIGCDLSIGTSPDSDYVVYTVLQIEPEIRILEVYRQNGISYKVQKAELLKLYKRYRPQMISIESNQYQAVFPQELKEDYALMPIEASWTGVDKHNYGVGVPSMKDYFELDQIKIGTGDYESVLYKDILFKELNGMIYSDGKVSSVQKHDDTVMSLWIAIKSAREHFGMFLEPI